MPCEPLVPCVLFLNPSWAQRSETGHLAPRSVNQTTNHHTPSAASLPQTRKARHVVDVCHAATHRTISMMTGSKQAKPLSHLSKVVAAQQPSGAPLHPSPSQRKQLQEPERRRTVPANCSWHSTARAALALALHCSSKHEVSLLPRVSHGRPCRVRRDHAVLSSAGNLRARKGETVLWLNATLTSPHCPRPNARPPVLTRTVGQRGLAATKCVKPAGREARPPEGRTLSLFTSHHHRRTERAGRAGALLLLLLLLLTAAGPASCLCRQGSFSRVRQPTPGLTASPPYR